MAAMYSKSASEGSSICGVERCGVVSPSHWYKRKFVLLSSHEAPGEVEVVVLQGKRRKGGVFGSEKTKLQLMSSEGWGLLTCTKDAANV